MLQRLAGPSRASTVLSRAFASSARADTVAQPLDSEASSSTSPSFFRDVPPHARSRTISADIDPIRHLNSIVSRKRSTSTPLPDAVRHSNDAWGAYHRLSSHQRRSLPNFLKRQVLRAIVPRFDDAENIANQSSGRMRANANALTSRRWEWRLKTVMSDILDRSDSNSEIVLADWRFVLRSLALLGHVHACEAILRQMPEQWRTDIIVIEHCLTAVSRYCRDRAESTHPRPKPFHVQYATKTLHDLFSSIQSSDIQLRGSSLDILLTAVQRVRHLAVAAGSGVDPESIQKLDQAFSFVLQQGYGFDLKTLSRQVGEFAPITPYVTNAVLDHLRTTTGPYRVLAAFEVLATRPVTPVEEAWDEDEDDIPTLSSMTAAEEAQQLGLFGQRQFFDSSPSFPATERFATDFLSLPPRPLDVQPDPEVTPLAITFNPQSIFIVLRSACDAGDYHLAIQILSNAIHSAKEARVQWLSLYKATPKNLPIWEPGLRISSKWFPPVFSVCRGEYGRESKRLSALARDAVEWAKEEMKVLEEVPGEYLLEEERPRRLRNLRNAGVFLGGENRRALAEEVQELEAVMERADRLEEWRMLRKAKSRAKRYRQVGDTERAARREKVEEEHQSFDLAYAS